MNIYVLFDSEETARKAFLDEKVVKKSLDNPRMIFGAFTWSHTKQGGGFWGKYFDGYGKTEHNEMARSLLRQLLEGKPPALEDVL